MFSDDSNEKGYFPKNLKSPLKAGQNVINLFLNSSCQAGAISFKFVALANHVCPRLNHPQCQFNAKPPYSPASSHWQTHLFILYFNWNLLGVQKVCMRWSHPIECRIADP
jgi:hypothetical protein